MINEKRLRIYNVLALVFALWFLLAGWTWVIKLSYIFLVYPFAIAGFFLWRTGQGAEKKQLNKIVGWVLWAGLVSSIGFIIAVAFSFVRYTFKP
ncbi:MAG: hypothetical protein AABY93_06635 [Bacteroidota bacterium]